MGGIMSDNMLGVVVVLGILLCIAFMGLSFSLGRASQGPWNCSEAAIVDGTAECVEYRKVEESK
jgi:hypothetical protein